MSDDSSSDDDGAADSRDDEADDDGGGRDPFDSFDEYRDRAGDPFDSLGGDSAGESGDSRGADERATDPTDGRESESDENGDPFEYGTSPEKDEIGHSSDPTRASADDPLADVEVSDEDPFESNPSAFERSDVEGIDPDEVWERLTDDGESEPDPESDGATGAEAANADGPSSPGDEDDVVEVSKHAYCEGCEHFSPPPDVTCTHPGTEILAFVDVDTVRVADCPVVAERRELEDDA
ncbi:hypothetical protein [Halosimplex sp. J119]